MSRINDTRRRLLKLMAASGAVGTVAGCIGDDDDDDADDVDPADDDDDMDPADDDDDDMDPADDTEEYPTQSIEVVVPFGAGGGTDTQYRGFQPFFEEELGVDTIVDNRPGASGRTGMNHLWGLEPDGYSIGTISVGTLAIGQVSFDTEYEIQEYGHIGISTAQFFAVVAEAGRFEDAVDFANWAQEADEIRHGSVGLGATNDFIGKVTLDSLGIDMDDVLTVPWDSGAEIVAAAARGDIDFGTPGELAAVPLREDGDIDVLWVARPDPSAPHPDAPTAPEVADLLGLDSLPDFGLELGFFAPPGTPQDRVDFLSDALVTAAGVPEFEEWAEDNGLAVFAADASGLQERIDIFLDAAEFYAEIVDED